VSLRIIPEKLFPEESSRVCQISMFRGAGWHTQPSQKMFTKVETTEPLIVAKSTRKHCTKWHIESHNFPGYNSPKRRGHGICVRMSAGREDRVKVKMGKKWGRNKEKRREGGKRYILCSLSLNEIFDNVTALCLR